MRVVVDTNVLVSGLLSPFGPPGVIVGQIASGQLCVCHDARILAEYDDVLRRPAFPFQPQEIAALLAQLRAGGEFVAARPLSASLPDADDEPFLEVAVTAMAEFLVTGNLKHFPADRCGGMRVVTPAAFLETGFDER